MVSFYVLMSSRPDKWLPWWNPIIWFINDPVKDIVPVLLQRGQPHLPSEDLPHVQFRRSISDWKVAFSALQGANGWPSPQGFSFPKVVVAANDKVSRWRGSHGVHTPPGAISKLLALYRHCAPWVITSQSILAATHPPETPSFISQSASALFVFQKAQGKSN